MRIVVILLALLVVVFAALRAWRVTEIHDEDEVWRRLTSEATASPSVFDESLIEGLPEPARRYFLATIEIGAPLYTVAEIQMTGEIGLGDKDDPQYGTMRAYQILAPPYGLVWKVKANSGILRIGGSDGVQGEKSWTRFWIFGVFPIVRISNDADHARSAFGRVIAEAVFWTPAALLPQTGTHWEFLDRSTARATISHKGFSQSVDVTINADGFPEKVVVQRWSNANPESVYRLQPFGGYLSEFKKFDGYMLPTRVEGGNFIDTDEYFPFYKAEIDEVKFVSPK